MKLLDLEALTILHGPLISTGQAGRVLGVTSGHVSVLLSRGKLPRLEVLGAVMIPARDVYALKRR